MKDFCGVDLKEGQQVVYVYQSEHTSWLKRGRVVYLTPTMVRIANDDNERTGTLRHPSKVVVVGGT